MPCAGARRESGGVTITPQQAADLAGPDLGRGDDVERFSGYGVMGVPFADGHYLAFRAWPTSSIGPGYRAVWHRDPDGRWTIYASEPPEVSCARYIGTGVHATRTVPVDIDWPASDRLVVTAGDEVRWELDISSTPATRCLSVVASRLPVWVWRTGPSQRLLGVTSGSLLGTGRMRLAGTTPNGQLFEVAPQRMWAVRRTRAWVRGRPLGVPRPLDRQTHLRDLWLPQRGIFYAATTARYKPPADPQPAGPTATIDEKEI